MTYKNMKRRHVFTEQRGNYNLIDKDYFHTILIMTFI